MEYVNLVSRRLNVQLPSTLIFDYPTSAAVTSFVATKLLPATPQQPEDDFKEAGSPAATAATSWIQPLARAGPAELTAAAAPSAVVSIMGTILHPFQATPAGTGFNPLPIMDSIVTVPLDRWEVDGGLTRAPSSNSAVRFGAFMSGVEEFDSSAFGLSSNEAAAMDPQHRLLLAGAGQLLTADMGGQGVGQDAAVLGTRGDVGVFVGISWTEYSQLGAMHGVPVGTYSAQGAVLSVACGR